MQLSKLCMPKIKLEATGNNDNGNSINGTNDETSTITSTATSIVDLDWSQFYTAAMRGRHKIPSLVYSRPKCTSPDLKYICEVCHAELQSRTQLDHHKLCHFNTSFVCYACDFATTAGAHSMAAHMGQHDQLNPLARHLIDNKQGFVCPVCLQKFTTDSTIAHHWAGHVEKERLACKLCVVEFNSLKSLIDHLTGACHKQVKLKMQTIFVCCDCHAVFSTRDSYAMHMMVRAQNETCKNNTSSLFPSSPSPSLSSIINFNGSDDVTLTDNNNITTTSTIKSSPSSLNNIVSQYSNILMPPAVLSNSILSRINDIALQAMLNRQSEMFIEQHQMAINHSNKNIKNDNQIKNNNNYNNYNSKENKNNCEIKNDFNCIGKQNRKRRSSFPQNETWRSLSTESQITPFNQRDVTRSVTPSLNKFAQNKKCITCKRIYDKVKDGKDDDDDNDTFKKNPLIKHIESYHFNLDKKPISCHCQIKFDNEFALKLHKKKKLCPKINENSSNLKLQAQPRTRKRKTTTRLFTSPSSSSTKRSSDDDFNNFISSSNGNATEDDNDDSVGHKLYTDEEDNDSNQQQTMLANEILNTNQKLFVCKFCKILFIHSTLHQLHMGLHNVNNPWQCNLCGKICHDVNDFSSHVVTSLHY